MSGGTPEELGGIRKRDQEAFVRETIAKYGAVIAFEALTDLGKKHSRGEGVLQDYSTAVKWWRIAADHGYAPAQTLLGQAYLKGVGVRQNSDEGIDWYLKAANQGDANAQYDLGWVYYGGERNPAEIVQALAWFYLAGDQGHKHARKTLSIIEENISSEQIEEAKRVAQQWSARFKKDPAQGQSEGVSP